MTPTLIAEAWTALATDHKPWGYIQNVDAGVLVFAVSEAVAECVLAWELNGQVSP